MGNDLPRRSKNRGFQQLRVWNDAVELYRLTSEYFDDWPFDRKKVASQAFASVDSIHRNIAEGYCRKSLKEYLAFLNYARGSLGESVSGFIAYSNAGHITAEQFEQLDSLAYKIENSLLRLIESLERKHRAGDWTDSLIVEESSPSYGNPDLQHKDDWDHFMATLESELET